MWIGIIADDTGAQGTFPAGNRPLTPSSDGVNAPHSWKNVKPSPLSSAILILAKSDGFVAKSCASQ
jgi:hypothetical protein